MSSITTSKIHAIAKYWADKIAVSTSTGIQSIGLNATKTALVITYKDGTTSEISAQDIMLTAIYDTNHNGVIDDSEKLGGFLPNHYATKEDIDSLWQVIVTDFKDGASVLTNLLDLKTRNISIVSMPLLTQEIQQVNNRISGLEAETDNNNTTIANIIKGDYLGVSGTDLLTLNKAQQGVIIDGHLLETLENQANKDVANGYLGINGQGRVHTGFIPVATNSFQGIVRIGNGIDIKNDGEISTNADILSYTNVNLPDSTTVKTALDEIGGNLTIIENEMAINTTDITNLKNGTALPKMSTTQLGVAKVGRNLSITSDGTLNVIGQIGNVVNYILAEDSTITDNVTSKPFKQCCQGKNDSRYGTTTQNLTITLPSTSGSFIPIMSSISDDGAWSGDYNGLIATTNLQGRSTGAATLKVAFFKRNSANVETQLAESNEVSVSASSNTLSNIAFTTIFDNFTMTTTDKLIIRFYLSKSGSSNATAIIAVEGNNPTHTIFSAGTGGTPSTVTINDVVGLPQVLNGTNLIDNIHLTTQTYDLNTFMSLAQIGTAGILYVRSGGANGDGSLFTPYSNLSDAQNAISSANQHIDILDCNTHVMLSQTTPLLSSLHGIKSTISGNIVLSKDSCYYHVANHDGNIDIEGNNITVIVDGEVKGDILCVGTNCKVFVNFFNDVTYNIVSGENLMDGSKIGDRTFGFN